MGIRTWAHETFIEFIISRHNGIVYSRTWLLSPFFILWVHCGCVYVHTQIHAHALTYSYANGRNKNSGTLPIFFSALQSYCSRLSIVLLSYDGKSTLIRLERRKKIGRVIYCKKSISVLHPIQSACLLYTSPSPRDGLLSRMPSSA